MAVMDEAVWRGKIYSGGRVGGGGGAAAAVEPATGAELGRTGIATPFTDTGWVTVRGDIAPHPF